MRDKKKQAKYQELEDLKNELANEEEIKIKCVSCGDIFYPIKDRSMTVRCPNCETTNKIE